MEYEPETHGLDEAYIRRARYLWNAMLHKVVPPQENEEEFIIRMAIKLAVADMQQLPPANVYADELITKARESLSQNPQPLDLIRAKLREDGHADANLSDAELREKILEGFREKLEKDIYPDLAKLFAERASRRSR